MMSQTSLTEDQVFKESEGHILVRCEIFFTYTSVYYIKNNMCHEITLLELLIPLSYPEITYSS